MDMAARHLPRRPDPAPNACEKFAFDDPNRASEVFKTVVWPSPRFHMPDIGLDIAVPTNPS